mmetsp:Transcript_25615/g.24906  ORF Transcript_25615/g.24906 Transcript_25615/m.24906 type:complete len:318 (+) Transcript_25615:1897-2850(+)
MPVAVHIFRQVMVVPLRDDLLLRNALEIIRVDLGVHIPSTAHQVGKWVVDATELELDLVVHGEDEVLELGEAQLIEVKDERQLLPQVEGQLSQTHPILGLSQDLQQGIFDYSELSFDLGVLVGFLLHVFGLLLVLVHSGGPDQQGLVVAQDILLDRVLDQLGQLAQRLLFEGGRPTDLHELGAPIPPSWDGPDVLGLTLLVLQLALVGDLGFFPALDEPRIYQVRLRESVLQRRTPFFFLLLVHLVIAEVVIQEVFQLEVELVIDLFAVLVHTDPLLLGLQVYYFGHLAYGRIFFNLFDHKLKFLLMIFLFIRHVFK